jgi:hypothetical protein
MPRSFAHAFDVATNVAVIESCLRKNLVVAFIFEIFNVWLIDNAVMNQYGKQARASTQSGYQKRSRRCRRLKELQGGVKQSGQEPLSAQEAGHASVMNPKA